MKYLWIIMMCLLCNCIASPSLYSWEEPLPTTRKEIARWFQEGIEQKATHMIVVCDQFSYEDFPVYVYLGELPQEKVNYWNSQEFLSVMEVYALHLNINTQMDEYRSWHLEPSLKETSVRSPLRLVNELEDSLHLNGMAVIFGAPASGKSEQMEVALKEAGFVFDLSQEFVAAYSKETGQDKKKLLDCYEGAFTAQQELLKYEQMEWLWTNHSTIVDSLSHVPNEIIILDEFDFTGSHQPSYVEKFAMIQMVEIGKELKQAGKKVVFIIHAAAKHSEGFWIAMKEAFGLESSDVVKTLFFDDQEEAYLLSQVDLNAEEKEVFLAFAKGSPMAYLPILQKKPDLTLEKLKFMAFKKAEAVIRHTKHSNRPDVWDALVAIAEGQIRLENIHDEELIEKMLESGFVGLKNGRLVMPVFAKESLREDKNLIFGIF